MAPIPRDGVPDSTLAFITNPYHFVLKRSQHLQTNIFQTRLALRNTICLIGREAAELFYDSERFMRNGAMPGAIQKTLTGQRGVQSLDDAAHRHRKQMFMSFVEADQIANLTAITEELWMQYARKWTSSASVVLYDDMRELLCQAVCIWTGIRLPDDEVKLRTQQLTALFQDAGSVSLKHFGSRLARRQAEQWIMRVVERIRSETDSTTSQSIVDTIARFQDVNGALLPPQVAAVEIINILRPTVAIAIFNVFVAHALAAHPNVRQKLTTGDEAYTQAFVQEVRRFYPLFPIAAAQARRDFEWNGYSVHKGTRVLLDLYGTNHDANTWDTPEQFLPERFLHWDGNLFKFIPQGGGNPFLTHRCPGEAPTIALMVQAAGFLVDRVIYDVPAQNLKIDYFRLPALPISRFVISNVRISPETPHSLTV
jgi:fatty-acid peroxygenase